MWWIHARARPRPESASPSALLNWITGLSWFFFRNLLDFAGGQNSHTELWRLSLCVRERQHEAFKGQLNGSNRHIYTMSCHRLGPDSKKVSLLEKKRALKLLLGAIGNSWTNMWSRPPEILSLSPFLVYWMWHMATQGHLIMVCDVGHTLYIWTYTLFFLVSTQRDFVMTVHACCYFM